jgi:hypothetical protein
MKQNKTETFSFRLTPTMKIDLFKRATESGVQPGEYIGNLISKDLASKAGELPERERTFLEKQFQQFSDTLLSFITDNFDKKLSKIQHSSALSNLTAYQSLIQSTQAALRTKEILSDKYNDEQKIKASDERIKARLTAIREDIKKELESGKY